MKSLLWTGFLFLSVSVSAAVAPQTAPTIKSFEQYIGKYTAPEFFQNNGDAFDARLKLLDQAPVGSKVKVLTFTFDNGEVTRQLGRHLCLAAERGLQVEFMADSKYGDRPGVDDAFDGTPGNKVNEDLYQYMANCGVKVMIHNHISHFIDVFGKKLPPLEPPTAMKPSELEFASGAKMMAKKFGEAVANEFGDIIDEEDAEALVATATKLIKGILLAKIRGEDGMLSEVEIAFNELKDNPMWMKLNTDVRMGQMKLRVARLQKVLAQDEAFMYATANIHRFNRLNHRKLFWVQAPTGKGCFILGGRNLGDHYLANHHDSFLDTDVMLCSQHNSRALDKKDLQAEAAASFDDLKDNLSDGVIGFENDNKISRITPNGDFEFEYLTAASHLQGKSAGQFDPLDEVEGLKASDRDLKDAKQWPNAEPIRGLPLPASKNWKIVRSHWNAMNITQDHVKYNLIRGISKEQSEIYLETAYAELDDAFRESIEKALKRGVNVHLVTNSLFISDGPSKLIRIFMAFWLRDLVATYDGQAINPETGKKMGKFTNSFTTYAGGHMIHFKGAGFKCQRDAGGTNFHKTFLIGSHNFHPRSGYSDKEHAVIWEEPADPSCMSKVTGKKVAGKDAKDMIDMRKEFYAGMNAHADHTVLTEYPSLFEELKEIVDLEETPENTNTRKTAEHLMNALYDASGKLRNKESTERLLLILRESNIREMLGTLL